MTRLLLGAAISLLVVAGPAQAGPIQVYTYGVDFFTNPAQFAGSRFEGNPTRQPLSVTGDFQGTVFSWLAIMRFLDQADFDAHRDSAVELVQPTPFTLTVGFGDGSGRFDAGHYLELPFNATVSGRMTYADPALTVTFDDPIGHAALGNALIDIALATKQHSPVTPAITFNGGVSIDPPLPIVTDIEATISLRDTSGSDGGGSDPPGKSGRSTPEPATLALAGLGAVVVTLRHLLRRR
jgi:PEP-CTERM motif